MEAELESVGETERRFSQSLSEIIQFLSKSAMLLSLPYGHLIYVQIKLIMRYVCATRVDFSKHDLIINLPGLHGGNYWKIIICNATYVWEFVVGDCYLKSKMIRRRKRESEICTACVVLTCWELWMAPGESMR